MTHTGTDPKRVAIFFSSSTGAGAGAKSSRTRSSARWATLILRVRDSCVRLDSSRRCGSRAFLAVETKTSSRENLRVPVPRASDDALDTPTGAHSTRRASHHRSSRRFPRSARSSHPNLPETRADLVRALASSATPRRHFGERERTFAMSANASALSLGAVPGTALRRSDSRRRCKTTGRRAVRVSAAIAPPVAGKVSDRPSDPAPAPPRISLSTPRHVRPSTSADPDPSSPTLPRPRSDSTRAPRSTSAATTAWRPTARSTCSAWSTPTARAPSP